MRVVGKYDNKGRERMEWKEMRIVDNMIAKDGKKMRMKDRYDGKGREGMERWKKGGGKQGREVVRRGSEGKETEDMHGTLTRLGRNCLGGRLIYVFIY